MRTAILALWSGEVSLARTFWEYGIVYGGLLNFLATLGFLALLTTETPVALAILGMAAPTAYNLLILVAVWRSAVRYNGPRLWADLARGVITFLVVLAILT